MVQKRRKKRTERIRRNWIPMLVSRNRKVELEKSIRYSQVSRLLVRLWELIWEMFRSKVLMKRNSNSSYYWTRSSWKKVWPKWPNNLLISKLIERLKDCVRVWISWLVIWNPAESILRTLFKWRFKRFIRLIRFWLVSMGPINRLFWHLTLIWICR